ncbi:hypothetical protein FE257_007848 [Aspergillus nanangensis]|uniref:Metallo-beta-lactamase domain-containing protein n=1 Tax=Aspergillus nanangensis TaxID=2582783 RepID=A0AAD4CX39_ASPNN|nr:hypothetical protein FE257_007848 [Aspergillus nanangensis]
MTTVPQQTTPEAQNQVESINLVSDYKAGLTAHASGDGGDEPDVAYQNKETSRILRKVDYRLLPLMTLLYTFAYLDRSNIGNARVAGMEADLNLTSEQYNIVLMVFFITYSLFESPSNSMLKVVKISTWLSIIVVTLQGICHNFHQMVVMRLLLGMFEAGFGPGGAYVLTVWYARYDLQKRMAIYNSGGCLAGAFSGLLAYGIVHMDGVAGLRGWRWIFILEGIITVLVGASLPWILPDSPDTASFFTEDEKKFMAARLDSDSGTSTGRVGRHDKLSWQQATLYAFNFTLPTIISRLGYSTTNAQLLTVPVYVLAIICNVSSGWLSDHLRTRWLFIVCPSCVSILALIGLISIPHPRLPGLAYFLLYLLPSGLYPGILAIVTWVNNNLAPSSKRVVGTAVFLSVGNLGGLAGSNIFLTREAPHYWLGYGAGIGFCLVAVVCAVILRVAYGRLNEERDAMSEEDVRARYTDQELEAMGDDSPLYRLFPVPPGAVASLYIIDTTGTVANMPADHLLQPHLDGFATFATSPSWAFLIEAHVAGRTRRVVFDLGFPQDIDSLPPIVADRLKASGFVFQVPKNTAEVLLEHSAAAAAAAPGGEPLKLNDIEAVVWSHWHADHQGDIQHFPASTDLVVGPGFSKEFLPAYPDGPNSPIRKKDLDGRKLREVMFDGPSTLKVGQFKAIDFFGDGSFYLLDTPGHAIGHIGGLVRTTATRDNKNNTFVFLGGDLSHHGGEIRPSNHISLASAAAALVVANGGGGVEHQSAALEVLEQIQTSRGRRTDEAFFDPVITSDFEDALRTIVGVQNADADGEVFFIAAHDDTLKGLVETYPRRANEWKAKGWREKSLWAFLRDFGMALDPAEDKIATWRIGEKQPMRSKWDWKITGRDVSSKGNQVYIADSNIDGAQTWASELNKTHGDGSVFAVQVDVSSWDSQAAAFQQAENTFRRIDYVFPVAGIGERCALPNRPNARGPYEKPDLTVMDVDGIGMIYSIWLGVQHFRRQKTLNTYGFKGKMESRLIALQSHVLRRFVGFTSSQPVRFIPRRNSKYSHVSSSIYTLWYGTYPFSSAVVGFTRTYGKIMAQENITLNAICPGIVETGISTPLYYEKATELGCLVKMDMMLEAFEMVLGAEPMSGECIKVVAKEGARVVRFLPASRECDLGGEISYARNRHFHDPIQE